MPRFAWCLGNVKQRYSEASVRVPFSITAPRRLAGGGQTVGHNVSLVDLFPTLCDRLL